uniref:Uroplakin 3B n=1 Tax=Podarcis muralis TaxID=64176 RepID=A0A670JSG9_PODMU
MAEWGFEPWSPQALSLSALTTRSHCLTSLWSVWLTISYTPSVSNKPLEGKTTQSTFALTLPHCIFDRFANASDNIWLVVTYANARFKNPKTPQEIPPYEALFTSHGYMTMKSTPAQYCKAGNPNTVLRVGGESSCKNDDTQTTCNGPLPSPLPALPLAHITASLCSQLSLCLSNYLELREGLHPLAISHRAIASTRRLAWLFQ